MIKVRNREEAWKVAQDILEHSSEDDLYVEAIMFVVANDVVKTFFEVH